MLQDLRFGTRMLLKHKGFTAVAVLTLALAIGVNTSIFSAVNALLLRPLPYSEPERIFWVEEILPQATDSFVPGAHLLDWNEHSRTLEGIAGYNEEAVTLTGMGEPERLDSCRISASFFPTLRTPLLLGRNFLPEEDRAGGDRVVIISHGLWERRFGSDPGVIGKSITLDDEGYRVVGVLPPDFRFFKRSELWLPLALDYQQEHGNQRISMVQAFARLKPGVSADQAKAEMETISKAYEGPEQRAAAFFQGRLQLTPLHYKLAGSAETLLLILLGAVVLILMIACSNVANLMLARAVARQKELAIRAAIGAGRFRLVRQMLTESLLLVGAGCALGLVIAHWLTKQLIELSPASAFGQIADLANIEADWHVLCFTLLVSLFSCVLFGLAPALQFSNPDLSSSLKEGGRTSLFHRNRTRKWLLTSEVALAVLLLIGAGLLLRSFVNLLAIDPGFRVENTLTARISLPYPRYEEARRRVQFQRELLDRVAALPGIDSVGAINHLPLTEFRFGVWLQVEGRETSGARNGPATPLGLVSPDYFRTLGIPLRAGRLFSEGDSAHAPRVIILSESLAGELFPDEDPLGKRVRVPGPGQGTPVVVGIVGDVRHQGLDREIKPMVYAPFQQNPPYQMILAVRCIAEPRSVVAALRDQVLAVDRDLPVYDVMSMDERLADSVATRRFTLMLLGGFALLALGLASLGVYGVVAYGVNQRTHEVGIRMAVGAQKADVVRLFIKQGMVLVLSGVAFGLLGAVLLARVMTSLLFDITATDPLTFGGMALLLTLIALGACYIPARRATRVDPLVALRNE